MSEFPPDNPSPDVPAVPAWRPSEHLRTRLLHGLVAVVLASGLTLVAAVLATALNQKGFTVAMGLGFIAILPQIWILLAYLGVAHETNSDGLKRTSVGIFGAGWLFQLLELTDESVLPEQASIALRLIVAVAALGLCLYCSYPLLKVVGCGGFLFVLLAVRGVRSLPRLLPGVKELDQSTQIVLVAGVLGLLVLLCLHVWFSISLIRLRDRLGGIAAIRGWAHLFGVAATIAAGAWLITDMVIAANHPEAIDQDIEELFGLQYRALVVVNLSVELFSALLTALLFWFVRQRGQTQSEHTWSDEGVS